MTVKSMIKPILLLGMCFSLSGCWWLLGELGGLAELRLLAGRAGISEAAGLGLRAGLGGEALAATRIAQANLGAIIAQDALLSRLASQSIRLQIGEGAASITGRASLAQGEVRVALSDGQVMRVTRPEYGTRFGMNGTFSDHFVKGQRVSFARYSSDSIRIDYFMRNAATGQFESPMYALRDPSGNSIAFFGRNHAYLGTAVYRTAATRSGVTGLAGGAVAFVVLNDFRNAPIGKMCAPELLILRKTYFNQGQVNETPDQFWESFYRDCKENEEVREDYQRFQLDKIYTISDSQDRYAALGNFLRRFPENGEAGNMKADIEGNRAR